MVAFGSNIIEKRGLHPTFKVAFLFCDTDYRHPVQHKPTYMNIQIQI